MYLYLTADNIATPTGGGVVTLQESMALQSLGETQVISRRELETSVKSYYDSEPWGWNRAAFHFFGNKVKLAHIYSGSFPECVKKLKDNGAKVTYTIAAHDKEISRREHEQLGIPFAYPHLTDPDLWRKYIAGYLAADVIICPSHHSADIVRRYEGFKGQIKIIPHGVDLPESIAPIPDRFVVGYLGAIGPDKGIRYLLEAWKKLNYPGEEAVLSIAGRDSTSAFMKMMVVTFGGITDWMEIKTHLPDPFYVGNPEGNGRIILHGWIDNVSTFYNGISLYCQPSATEGFGIEVLEAMAHGRPVICSANAGAADILAGTSQYGAFRAMNVEDLASSIEFWKDEHDGKKPLCSRGYLTAVGMENRGHAKKFTWDKIRQRYVEVWKGLAS